MSGAETITELLRALSGRRRSSTTTASLIASALPADIEEGRVAAMSAALLGMSERIVREL